MANACGPGCGFCGRCEDKTTYVVDIRDHRYPDPCDWCDKLVMPEDQLLVNHGGRFCSDECAANWAEAEAAGDISRKAG